MRNPTPQELYKKRQASRGMKIIKVWVPEGKQVEFWDMYDDLKQHWIDTGAMPEGQLNRGRPRAVEI